MKRDALLETGKELTLHTNVLTIPRNVIINSLWGTFDINKRFSGQLRINTHYFKNEKQCVLFEEKKDEDLLMFKSELIVLKNPISFNCIKMDHKFILPAFNHRIGFIFLNNQEFQEIENVSIDFDVIETIKYSPEHKMTPYKKMFS